MARLVCKSFVGRQAAAGFHEVDADAQTAVFRPANPADGLLFRPGVSYPYLEGYWGERAALVMDRGRKWRRRPFAPTDAVTVTKGGRAMMPKRLPAHPGGSHVRPGGWDHEHCAICGKTIGHAGELQGYVDSTGTWVCARRHSEYVAQRSVGFIRDAPGCA
jgi:hypothetical protein